MLSNLSWIQYSIDVLSLTRLKALNFRFESCIIKTMSDKVYRLLIVDDEQEIAERIRAKITPDLGFDVVGIANNGHDALELMDKVHPDAVVTDIRMPYINGLELAKRIRVLYPKTKVAFISGYDEFEYAKEAIHLDVVSYLSKPIETTELHDFLKRLKSRLDEEHQAVFNQDRLNDMFLQNRQVLIENQFNSLLHGLSIQETELQRFKVFGIDLTIDRFITGIIEIDAIADFYEVEYLRVFLVNLLHKKFQEPYRVYTFNSGFGFVFILHHPKVLVTDVENILNEVVLTKREFSDIHIQIGLSNVYDRFVRFPNSVSEAKKALSFSSYMNVGTLIFYRDILERKKIDLKMSRQDIETIESVIKFGSEGDIHTLFNNLRTEAEQQKESLVNNQSYLINLAHIFIDFSSSLSLDVDELLDSNLYDTLKAFDQFSQVYDFLEDLVFRLKSINQQSAQNSVKDLFDEAVHYLENHYADPLLGMENVSEHLGISVSYLSSLFKKHVESTFNKELVRLRMEKAQELLLYTPKKIYEIAELVGYSDVYYFSFSFKKHCGKTPKEFRSEAKN